VWLFWEALVRLVILVIIVGLFYQDLDLLFVGLEILLLVLFKNWMLFLRFAFWL
jgi:hypothetical protein